MLTSSLKLQLEQDKLSIIDDKNGVISTETVEWVANNSQRVALIVDNPKDDNDQPKNYYFVINNSNNEPIEQLKMDYVPEENGNGYFVVNSHIVSLLKTGSKINIGVGYEEIKNDIIEIRNSNTILATITNGVNIGITPKEVSDNKSLMTQILSQISTEPLVAEIQIESENTNTGFSYSLKVRYRGETEWKKIGTYTTTPETLGIILERTDADRGGGGKVGIGTELQNEKTGFAGGYIAETSRGGAIGENTYSVNGVAAGFDARTVNNSDGIAIGQDAKIGNSAQNGWDNTKENSSIAIGTNSLVINYDDAQKNNIAIGKYAVSYQSENSIAIGTSNELPDGKNYFDLNGGERKFLSTARTRVNYARKGIAIGYQAYVSRASTSLSIGTYATVMGRAPSKDEDGKDIPGLPINRAIAIGTLALSRAGGSIAIGPRAIAGATAEGELIAANENYESGKDAGLTSAIAIGYRAKGSTIGSIAIGKRACAWQRRTIAIGEKAEAGEALDKTSTKGMMHDAVAIGSGAKSKALGAVQIGAGENTTSKSLKFRDVTIVSDGAVQVNLKQGVSGVLSIDNGGTGANSASEARRNLGVFTGRRKIQVNTETIAEKGIEGTVEFRRVLSSVPQVVASLEFSEDSTNINPSEHHIVITNITTKGFTYKYNYTGAKKKFNPYINFVAIVL